MATVPVEAVSRADGGMTREHRRLILASSLGTVFEWYDFYLYGALAGIIARQFFTALDATSGFIFALLAFAAGFAVRPFGALVFGRLGDKVGRKHTFLVTIVLMGVSTCLVGILPGYASIGIAAPIILIVLRLLQGLALGGEYGGAATYVAEHAPPGRRGFYTSFIQTTATLGLLLSLVVILACRGAMDADSFARWGWRIPFLLSIVLLGVSVWIRLQLAESPLFQQMQRSGRVSQSPIRESFFSRNGRVALLALLGATAGQAVVWYCGQFYALFFLTHTLKVDLTLANLLMAGALILATPFFVLFGWLSDRVGRKPIVLAGCLIAALTYFPIFRGLTHYANPQLEAASATAPITLTADVSECAFQFVPSELKSHVAFRSACDIAKTALAGRNLPYRTIAGAPGSGAVIRVGSAQIDSFDGRQLAPEALAPRLERLNTAVTTAVAAAGYPAQADPARINRGAVLALLTLLVLYVTMVYGPIAAWLVELFPTRIRYTSMSLPYHIGNGWFGGFLPTTAFALVALTGDPYAGLWYPIVVAVATVIIGGLFLRDTRDADLN
ncbi:MFS transporter [Tahibacter amnicola]|uniref:MFS transporter n=1 Tax=Tahibacter amnicola TaxID=2976241 RepID=A0ABY6BEE9_9GAMM|nr:MFS transporter [Tahibacter amnicola]UXI68406.1 MFS transporter [Tahibacter amnicola]